jgi:glycosyltransferase involved in cell wall biosynthesis
MDVSVWSDAEKGGTTPAGVRWHTVEDYDEVVRQGYDFLILNRGIGNGLPEVKAKHRVLWTHDLPHGGMAPRPEFLKALSATVFMSKYAERVWRLYYHQIGRSFLIPNGVDKEMFHPQKKDLNYLIFISAPNRGLDKLGVIYASIKKKVGRPLYMRAYSNMKILHPHDQEGDDIIRHEDGSVHFGQKYRNAAESGVEILDPLPQPLLAEELGRAGLMIMPTGYPEICSNAILQALASGVPIVTTGNLGSATEWIRHGWNGALTTTHLEDYTVHLIEIMRGAVVILENEKLHRAMIKNAERTKGIKTWEEIGTLWVRMLRGLS